MMYRHHDHEKANDFQKTRLIQVLRGKRPLREGWLS